MLKLWGDGRGVMGGDGEKCGVAVLGIWGSRKWVAGERGAPSAIRGSKNMPCGGFLFERYTFT